MPTFSMTGPVWVVGLSHQEAESVEASLGAIAGTIATTVTPAAAIAGPNKAAFAAEVAGAIGASAGYIEAMDAIGGDNGVDVNGVLGVVGFIVTPHASGLFGTLLQAARVGVAGKTIVDFVLKASSEIPAVATSMNVSVAASVFSGVAAGTPLGWALAGAAGIAVKLWESAPDPNEHGGIHADRTTIGNWERFTIVNMSSGNQIALMSWQGLFSAQGGGGGSVFANRTAVGPWETWKLLSNSNGTYSFQSINGQYLTATAGGGTDSYCLSDRTVIGTWEQFYLQPVPGGQITIKTHDRGTYLSVQSGT